MSEELMIGEYKMDEVSSALNKEIRRGNEEEAMYWAMQFVKAKLVGYLWRRLSVIALEDCADETIPFVHACMELSSVSVKGVTNEINTNALARCILMMCRCPKSREACDFDWLVQKKMEKKKLEIPDYALDSHTARGRKMGRTGIDGLIFFDVIGAKLNQEYPSKYKKEALQLELGLPEESIDEIMKAGNYV